MSALKNYLYTERASRRHDMNIYIAKPTTGEDIESLDNTRFETAITNEIERVLPRSSYPHLYPLRVFVFDHDGTGEDDLPESLTDYERSAITNCIAIAFADPASYSA